MTSRNPPAGPFDLERIRAETFVRAVEYHREIGSTNDRALQLAADPGSVTPLLVLAERQTAGRGRGANRWWSSDGALTFSLLLSDDDIPLRGSDRPKIALLTGLAVCETVTPLVAPAVVQLKWPNDVLIDSRKVCGILVEAVGGPGGRVVIGVGANVNNSLREVPAEVRERATSLADVAERPCDASSLLVSLLDAIRRELGAQTDDGLDLRWRSVCALRGRVVRLDVAGRRVTGLCEGVDAAGSLVVQTEAGPVRVLSGVVVGWE